jgi:hypothetical protein
MVDTVDLEVVIVDGIPVACIVNGGANWDVPQSVSFALYSSDDFFSISGYDAFVAREMYFTSCIADFGHRDE